MLKPPLSGLSDCLVEVAGAAVDELLDRGVELDTTWTFEEAVLGIAKVLEPPVVEVPMLLDVTGDVIEVFVLELLLAGTPHLPALVTVRVCPINSLSQSTPGFSKDNR